MPPLFSKPEEDGPGLLKRIENNAAAVRYALFGYPGARDVNAALDPDPTVTNRASMLPIGNYSDGSVGLAWPQSLVDAKEAFGRLHNNEPPQPQDAVLAGLAMTGGAFSGAAARGSGNINLADPIRARWINRTAPREPVASEFRPAFEPSTSRYTGNDFVGSAANDARGPAYARAAEAPGGIPLTETGDAYFDAWLGQKTRNTYFRDGAWDRLAEMGFNFRPEARTALLRRSKERGGGGDGNVGDPVLEFQREFGAEPWWFDPLSGKHQPELGQQPHPRFLAARDEYDQTRPRVPGKDGPLSYPDDYLSANPKEAAPAGLLATSNLDRMRAAENAPARPGIPDAPRSLPEVEAFARQRFPRGQSAADEAFRTDPQRYMDYARGLHDVINPESNWIRGEPTLHAGGSPAGLVPFGGPAPGLMQQPEEAPARGLMAQQSPGDRLRERGYQKQPPPVQQFEQNEDLGMKYLDALFARAKEYMAQGMSEQDAREKARQDADIHQLWKKSMGMP